MNDFDVRIRKILPEGLQCQAINTLQINIGRYCNLECTHCHLECSPGRKEMMSWEVMEKILAVSEENVFRLVDITGGSPELHPDFIPFVTALRDRGQTVQIRSNLTVLMESSLSDIIPFLKTKEVHLVGSLPCYLEENVDAQRGAEVYKKSIAVIRLLNRAGYGVDTGLPLNLTFNPGGPFLPPDQSSLEEIYRQELKSRFDISFSRLIILTNMPLGRFRQCLERNRETTHYLSMLKAAFNPATIAGLMCRNQISVDWDGTLYDCDFNLALGMGVNHGTPQSIKAFDYDLLKERQIATGIHCYGCTAGAGSSCSGSIIGNESEHSEDTYS
jgi:radical SAM/Cys-rich protein